MNKELALLYVEDDQENREGLAAVLTDEKIGDYTIKIETIDSFDDAFAKIVENKYHIVILDLFKGKPDDGGEQVGLEILEKIQKHSFVPVIFYSGNTKNVEDLKSQIIGIVTKGDDGIEGLKNEIERLVKFNLPFLKENLHNYIEQELKTYFWDIIHTQRNKFTADLNDLSLGYLMLRKFGNSLSKEKISKILQDKELKENKIHPMEFYIYPTEADRELECGEILQKDNNVFVILTPTCDFMERFGKGGASLGRKVGMVLLAKTKLLIDTEEYKLYSENKKADNKAKLEKLVTSGKTDRYFFLPKTPFIENIVIDFQEKEMIAYENVGDFVRLAKLDSPFAEGMVASFIRYYNRIGYPDIDADYVIDRL